MAEPLQHPPVISTDSPTGFTIMETRPDKLLRHSISDEELTMLEDTRRDYLWEGKWVALGVLLGAAQGCFVSLKESFFSTPQKLLSIVDLLQIIIFFGALVAFGILWCVMKTKTGDSKDLAKAIRERTAREI